MGGRCKDPAPPKALGGTQVLQTWPGCCWAASAELDEGSCGATTICIHSFHPQRDAIAVLCLSHQQDQCNLALISMYALNFTVFAPSMVFSSILLFIKVQCSSQRRQPRRLYIVIFLTVLFFLLFMVPLSIWNFTQHFSAVIGHSQVVFLLACINSSINPFIYFLVGGCQRRCSLVSLQVAFRRVFEELADDTVCSDNATMDTLSPVC
ncbi:Mas-related G-protein coupled receptor member H-like protein [Aix galericulata]|nr:Mas-related G-protein coupled receptor member H-like protein [Aix galericulata]